MDENLLREIQKVGLVTSYINISKLFLYLTLVYYQEEKQEEEEDNEDQ